MSGRRLLSAKAKYGFNGQLKDNEVYGEGNSTTAEFWQYDPRLGRRMNLDPSDDEWESPYAAFMNTPVLLSDVQGDTEDERKKAASSAKEYKAKNPGNSYSMDNPRKNAKPGEKMDCSTMIRSIINSIMSKDPSIPSPGDGDAQNGVALLANSPMVRKSSIDKARIGDMVTIDTGREGKPWKNGKYDHVGIISSVTYDDKGNVTGFDIIHSGGDPKKGKSGPALATYKVDGTGAFAGKIRGVFQWDTPEAEETKENAIAVIPIFTRPLVVASTTSVAKNYNIISISAMKPVLSKTTSNEVNTKVINKTNVAHSKPVQQTTTKIEPNPNAKLGLPAKPSVDQIDAFFGE